MRTLRKLLFGAGIFAVLYLLTGISPAAEQPDKSKRSGRDDESGLQKTASLGRYQILNINNLWTWHRNDGQSNHSPTGVDGTFYPRGTRWVIYQDGIVWGGKVYRNAARTDPAPVQLIRVGGATYNIGTRAGWVTGSGATAVAASPDDPRARVYRIRRDYAHMTVAELQKDAAESFELHAPAVTDAHVAEIKANYEKDWKEWPVELGAPYIERNGIRGYQKPPEFNLDPLIGPVFTVDSLIKGKYDEPGIAGADPDSPADQVLWMVFNDLDRVASRGLYGSEPMGLEIQKTIWGYKRTDAMGNLYFQRVKVINKGGVDIGGGRKGSFWIDSMYLSKWSDPDLGAFGNDLAGCDTVLSLGFVYNGTAVDAEFAKFGLPPPAVGYDFLQGPMVAGRAADSAVFDLKRVRGKRNLPMTSFAYFSAGAPISDPPLVVYEGSLRWWKMLRGFRPNESTAVDTAYPHPPGMPTTAYPLSGDPVRGTGFIDGAGTAWSFAPGDRRIVLNSGPFVLAPGDTQEVVLGVVAGLGGDRLSSITVMKANDRSVQETYDLLFRVAKAPAAPKVRVAELDGEIVLEWGSDEAAVRATETPIALPGEYRFEGYNVYQLPLKDSPLKDAKLLATYDLTIEPRVVFDEVFDLRSAQFIRVPVQFGSNSGIKRYFHFKRDYVRDIDKLYNGQEYYLAVTAYSVAQLPGYTAALESGPIVLTVRPQSPKPGTRIIEKAMKSIPNRVVAGKTDVKEIPIIMIDPEQAKTATYRITFFDSIGVPWWRLSDHTARRELFRSRNLGFQVTGNPDDDYEFPIINGFQPRVLGEPYVVRADSTRWIPDRPPELGAGTRFAFSPGVAALGVTPAWDIFHPGTGVVRYLGVFESSWSILLGVPIEIRFGPAHGSKAYSTRRLPPAPAHYNVTGFRDIPFSAWDVSVSPARQLTVAWRDQDNNGRWNPPEGDDNVEVFWVYNKTYDPLGRQFTYPGNPDPAKNAPAIPGEPTIGAAADIMYVASFHGGPGGVSGLPGSVSTATLRVVPTYPLNSTVVIEFSTKAPEYSVDVAKADVLEKIGVFPNPYYAFNAAETNRFIRFVTFNFLPPKARIRIFNLAGQLVRTIEKNDPSQFLRWDLNNQHNFPVASGIYIAHIDMPDLGVSKVLKLAIIQEQEILETY